MTDDHPHGEHPHDDEPAVVPNPYYEALSDERKEQAHAAQAEIQALQDKFDQEVLAVHGGLVFAFGEIILGQSARILWLEQRLEELESKHQRHTHEPELLA